MMEKPGFLVLGHLTKDMSNGSFRLGGTAAYAAVTAARLGCKVAVVTSAGRDLDWASALPGIEVCYLHSPVTTTFRNIYQGDRREQFILAVARKLTIRNVPREWRDTPIVLLGPVAQELDPGLARAFPRSLIGVTPQGWMRRWDEQGRVFPKPWEDAAKVLPHSRVLVLSLEDAGYQEAVIATYAAEVPVLVVTEGDRGARVHHRGEWHHVSAFPAVPRAPTGAGDVFAASYLVHFAHSRDALAAALFANCVASFAVERDGVENLPTLGEIRKRLADRGVAIDPEIPFLAKEPSRASGLA